MALAHTTPGFSLLTKEAYFRALIANVDAAKPGTRILITTMTLHPRESLVAQLIEALAAAARRNVEVHFAFDAYNYLVHPETRRLGPLLARGLMPAEPRGVYRDFARTVDLLRQAGASVFITNMPTRRRANPFAGRSHIKTAIVGSTVYLGGCNLGSPEDLDAMVTFDHKPSANWLFGILASAIASGTVAAGLHYRDQSFAIDTQTRLLLDAGVPHQSLIYDQALRFIDESDEWLVITCQFFPNSTTAARLLAAHRRGVDVKIVFNHPHKHPGLHHKALQLMVRERERLRMPRSFFAYQLPQSSPFLHAKILASEKGAIIGSHNYVKAGVQFGTAELALQQNDPAFGTLLRDFVEQQITGF